MTSLSRCVVSLALTVLSATASVAQTLPSGVIDVPSAAFPSIADRESIGSNTTMNVFDGGFVGSFFEAGLPGQLNTDVFVNIEGGTVDGGLSANPGAVVNINGGTVGNRIKAFEGGVLNIRGGFVSGIEPRDGSVTNISGGTIGGTSAFVGAFEGATVNISGGEIIDSFFAASDTTINISGGDMPEIFRSQSGSTVNVTGTEFFLDGIPIDLEPGLKTVIDERDRSLTGRLADGTDFEFDLIPAASLPSDLFPTDATLTLTRAPIPEPASGVLASLVTALGWTRRRTR